MAASGRETEFEEDSFEDDFEPEDDMAQYKNVPKPQPRMTAPRGSAHARQLAALLQRNVSLQSRQPHVSTTPGRSSSAELHPLSSSSSGAASAAAAAAVELSTAAAAGSMLTDALAALAAGGAGGLDEIEDDDDPVRLSSPKSLKMLSAQLLLLSTVKNSLAKLTIPGHLYSVLLAEAARMMNEDCVVHLVSTWPLAVLNLNDVDIPLDDYVRRETPTSLCVSDLIVKGLLYRKHKYCNLQMLVLPKDTVIGQLLRGHGPANLAASSDLE